MAAVEWTKDRLAAVEVAKQEVAAAIHLSYPVVGAELGLFVDAPSEMWGQSCSSYGRRQTSGSC
jgi:hypothetical protein